MMFLALLLLFFQLFYLLSNGLADKGGEIDPDSFAKGFE